MRERTRERVNYHRHDSINPVIPSEFNAGKEQQGIETTNTRYKNSSSYGHLKEHKTIPSSNREFSYETVIHYITEIARR